MAVAVQVLTSIIILTPMRIAGATPGTLDEMTLINLFCKLADSSATM
jgi:hypothetical protein